MRLGIGRALAQRDAIMGDRVVDLALLVERDPQIVVRFGEFRRERDRSPVGGNGGIELSAALERDAEIGVQRRVAVIERQSAADQRHRSRVVALLMRQHAEEVQRVAVVGLAVEDLAVEGRRLGKHPGTVEGHGLAHERADLRRWRRGFAGILAKLGAHALPFHARGFTARFCLPPSLAQMAAPPAMALRRS